MTATKTKKYVELPPDTEKKFLGLFTKDSIFYKTFFSLLVIIALQQLSALAVNMANNIMLGTYTELALSGATLVNQLQFILQQIAAGIGMGVVVLAAQYWGQKRTGPIKKIISVSLKCALIIGIVFFVISLTIPHQVLSIFTSDQAVINEGCRYLKIMCWTYLIFSVSNTLMYALQAVETAIIGTIMSLSTLCINICLNYCLIYGNFGCPELGIEGAAYATLTSRIVELFIILVFVLKIDKKLKCRFRELVQWDFTFLKDFLKISSPMLISNGMWGINQAAQTTILGHISATAIAANSIAVAIFQVIAVLHSASANVGQVVTGKTIGEGKISKIKSYSKTMQMLFILMGLVSGALIFFLREPVVSLYTVSPEAKKMAVDFLLVLSITTIGSCYEFPVEAGIIAGGGSTRYVFIVDNIFMWLLVLPCAFLSAFVFHFPPVATFFFLKMDQLLKCIPNSIVANRYRWVRILTRKAD